MDFENACLKGNAYTMTCVALGYLYSQDIPLQAQKKLEIARDFSKSNAILNKACEMGNNFGCSLLAVAYSDGNGVEIDSNKVQFYLQKSQKYGKLERLANNLVFMTAPFLEKLLSGEELNYRTGVEVGAMVLENQETMNLTKTILGASFLLNDKNMKINVPKARYLLEQSCQKGESLACDILGVLTSKGLFVAQNQKESLGFFQKSCKSEDSIGCALLAKYYQNGIGTKVNNKEASVLLGKAQYGFGSLEGVLASYALALYPVMTPNKGLDYSEALKGIPLLSFMSDDKPKKEIFQTSCQNGSVIDCNILGIYYLIQKSQEEKQKGFALVEKNCKNGDNFGCTILGLNYEFGLYSSVDTKKAANLFEKTQKDGTLESFANTVLRLAFYVAKSSNDNQNIKELLQYGCQNGLKAECDSVKVIELFEKYNQYQLLLNKSCEMGNKEACNS